jgi:hypothetical protein
MATIEGNRPERPRPPERADVYMVRYREAKLQTTSIMVQPTMPLKKAPTIRPQLRLLKDHDQKNIKKTQSAAPTSMRTEADTVSRMSMKETIRM